MISTTIDPNDYDFVKLHGLKMSELLREAIKEAKQRLGVIETGTLKEEVRRKEAFMKKTKKMTNYLIDKGLLDDYLEKEDVLE